MKNTVINGHPKVTKKVCFVPVSSLASVSPEDYTTRNTVIFDSSVVLHRCQ